MADHPVKLPKKKWIEPVVAVLMALTSLGTAWCSYESAAWTRRSNRLMNESNMLERRAAVLQVQGKESMIIHAMMFMNTLAAKNEGNDRLANFYIDRYPPELKMAFDQWMKQNPFENRDADAHPFISELYELRGAAEASGLRDEAMQKVTDARQAGNYSGQYLANTVIFATVLFFAGTAGKFEQQRVKVLAAYFAMALLVYALIRIFMLPVA